MDKLWMSAVKYFSYFEGKSTLQQIQSTKMKVTGSEEPSIIQLYTTISPKSIESEYFKGSSKQAHLTR